MKYTVLVLCLVSCVKGDDGYEFVRPTPVLRIPARIQSTDPLNPLKLNVQTEPKIHTTFKALNPTSVHKQLQTTAAAEGVADASTRKQLTTTFAANPLVDPTPVLNEVVRLETGPGNPMQLDLPIALPLTTTAVINNAISPTPVVLTLHTKLVEIPLTYENEAELQPPIGNDVLTSIQPSQVPVNDEVLTGPHTSELEQGPDQVLSTKLTDSAKQNRIPCKCKFEENPGLSFPSYNMENALTPQLVNIDESKPNNWDVTPPRNDIRQLIVTLQINLYVNNIPVLAAQAVPLYF